MYQLKRTCQTCNQSVRSFVLEAIWNRIYICIFCEIGETYAELNVNTLSLQSLSSQYGITRLKAAKVLRTLRIQAAPLTKIPSVHCRQLHKNATKGITATYDQTHMQYTIEYSNKHQTGCCKADHAAEKKFGLPLNTIPHATIYRKLKGHPKQSIQIRTKRKLGFVEERFLVQHLIMKVVRLTYSKVNEETINIVTYRGRPNPYKTQPSTGFWRGLLRRHPELSQVFGIAK